MKDRFPGMSRSDLLIVLVALVYILSPFDAVPEAIAGPLGLSDDVAAVRDIVMDSSRHIVSTTITTFGGFLPLILAGRMADPETLRRGIEDEPVSINQLKRFVADFEMNS